MKLVDPRHERLADTGRPAPRLASLAGKSIGLLDISKPGGNLFLDRLEPLLHEKYGVTKTIRVMKPAFSKPAPPDVLEALRAVDAVIEALAD